MYVKEWQHANEREDLKLLFYLEKNNFLDGKNILTDLIDYFFKPVKRRGFGVSVTHKKR